MARDTQAHWGTSTLRYAPLSAAQLRFMPLRATKGVPGRGQWRRGFYHAFAVGLRFRALWKLDG
jgi:hypothetical protein